MFTDVPHSSTGVSVTERLIIKITMWIHLGQQRNLNLVTIPVHVVTKLLCQAGIWGTSAILCCQCMAEQSSTDVGHDTLWKGLTPTRLRTSALTQGLQNRAPVPDPAADPTVTSLSQGQANEHVDLGVSRGTIAKHVHLHRCLLQEDLTLRACPPQCQWALPDRQGPPQTARAPHNAQPSMQSAMKGPGLSENDNQRIAGVYECAWPKHHFRRSAVCHNTARQLFTCIHRG